MLVQDPTFAMGCDFESIQPVGFSSLTPGGAPIGLGRRWLKF